LQIALWYETSKQAENLATSLVKEFGVAARAYRVRVENYEEVEAAVNQAVQEIGRVDVMIANAGIPSKAGGLDSKLEDWNRVRAVDFDGAYHCARAVGFIFKEQGRKHSDPPYYESAADHMDKTGIASSLRLCQDTL